MQINHLDITIMSARLTHIHATSILQIGQSCSSVNYFRQLHAQTADSLQIIADLTSLRRQVFLIRYGLVHFLSWIRSRTWFYRTETIVLVIIITKWGDLDNFSFASSSCKCLAYSIKRQKEICSFTFLRNK